MAEQQLSDCHALIAAMFYSKYSPLSSHLFSNHKYSVKQSGSFPVLQLSAAPVESCFTPIITITRVKCVPE